MTAKESLKILSGDFSDVTLRDGESHADVYAEAFNMAYEALEKADKYRWHDLRKNPDDLPCKDGLYAITIQYDEESSETGFGQYENMYGYTSGWSATMPSYGKIIAWKEIEPFEVIE